MSSGIAVPGTPVPTGSLVATGGAQGIQGLQGVLNPSGGFYSLFGAYTVIPADSGKYFICLAPAGTSWALTLPTLARGFLIQVRNDGWAGGTQQGSIILTPPAGATIDGATSLALLPSQECTILCDGSGYRTLGRNREVVLGTFDITSAQANQVILLPVGYRLFDIDVTGYLPATTTVSLTMQLSSNGGASFLTTGYYDAVIFNPSSSTAGGSAVSNGANMRICPQARNNATDAAQIKLRLWPGDGTKSPSWLGQASAYVTSPGCIVTYGFGGNNYTMAGSIVNAAQLLATTGNILNASITVRGTV